MAAPRRATIYASVFGKADDVPVQSLVYDQDFGIPAVAVAVQGSDILLERPSGWRWRRKYTRLRLATVREKRQFAAVRKLHKQASAHAKPR
ncbi:hypothetical protein EYS09_20750 [Streptomyces kasugaensis]|uniref:Uncharacterized protein n=1 Tax=Streptomyces kasugaensis TaxID=1946 RepID=A0A4V2JIB0_STRKA|nr:hypothetical protein [Streptomyces kasugaensis]TBO57801.1 hypothetical protein EYS09_20750 [Streptomyces kasugaensis]